VKWSKEVNVSVARDRPEIVSSVTEEDSDEGNDGNSDGH
jgi:hypothetical protein